MFKKIAAIAIVPLIAACSTTSPEVRLAQHQNQCAAYGFRSGTEAYANCMMQMDLASKAEDSASKERIRNGLLAVSQSLTPRRPITCNTYGTSNSTYSAFGNTVYGNARGNATTTCQ